MPIARTVALNQGKRSGPSPLPELDIRQQDRPMPWYLRAVELEDGRWSCRHGLHTYDLHADLAECVAHLRLIAQTLGPSELFMHPFEAEATPII